MGISQDSLTLWLRRDVLPWSQIRVIGRVFSWDINGERSFVMGITARIDILTSVKEPGGVPSSLTEGRVKMSILLKHSDYRI